MTEEEMWEAVQHSDASYDGLFFYAVKTTGISAVPRVSLKRQSEKTSAILHPVKMRVLPDIVHANVAVVIFWTINR